MQSKKYQDSPSRFLPLKSSGVVASLSHESTFPSMFAPTAFSTPPALYEMAQPQYIDYIDTSDYSVSSCWRLPRQVARISAMIHYSHAEMALVRTILRVYSDSSNSLISLPAKSPLL